jgi:hypothetical protein
MACRSMIFPAHRPGQAPPQARHEQPGLPARQEQLPAAAT